MNHSSYYEADVLSASKDISAF